MSPRTRNYVFIAGLAMMVCALNAGIYFLGGAVFVLDDDNKTGPALLAAVLIAGPLAISLSGYVTATHIYRLDRGRTTAAKAGLLSVLGSYLLLGPILWFLFPVFYFLTGGVDAQAIGLAGFVFAFAGMIMAFMVSVWLAVPLAVCWAMILSKPPDKAERTEQPSLVRLCVFSLSIFVAAVWVSHLAIPLRDNRQGDMLDEMTFACGLVSAIVGALTWYVYMEQEESRLRGAFAGATTAWLSLLLIGPAFGLYILHQNNAYSFDSLFSMSLPAAVFSFFAVILAAWMAFPISGLIGLLVAKTRSGDK